MEVDERLQVGSYELIDNEYRAYGYEQEQPHGHSGHPKTVATFETHRQPVDYHAEEE